MRRGHSAAASRVSATRRGVGSAHAIPAHADSHGQIGRTPDPGPEPQGDPAVEIGGLGWLAVTAGRSHVCALRRYPGATAASLYCWGDNRDGQLGLGDRVDRHAPTPVCPP